MSRHGGALAVAVMESSPVAVASMMASAESDVPNNGRGVIREAASTWRRHQLVQYGARAAKRAAPTDKSYARATGVSQPTANRRRNGDPYAPETAILAHIDALASGDHTTAVPLLVQGWIVVMERAAERETVAQLEARLARLRHEYLDVQRDIGAANYDGDDALLIEAHTRAAEIHAGIVAAMLVLRERRSGRSGA